MEIIQITRKMIQITRKMIKKTIKMIKKNKENDFLKTRKIIFFKQGK